MLCYVLAHEEQSTLLVAMHGSYLQEADTSQHVSEQGVYLPEASDVPKVRYRGRRSL